MNSAPRFSIELTLRDGQGYQKPIRMVLGVDDEMRISPRIVDDIKVGADIGVGLVSFDSVVRVMKQREFRKDMLIEAARRLGAQMAERMEDAEGWHDTSRIEPARKQLGGDWR